MVAGGRFLAGPFLVLRASEPAPPTESLTPLNCWKSWDIPWSGGVSRAKGRPRPPPPRGRDGPRGAKGGAALPGRFPGLRVSSR